MAGNGSDCCVKADDFSNQDHSHTTFVIVVGFWMTGALCVLGLIGNTLCLFIIQQRKNCAMFILLRGLLICDAIFILLTLNFQVVVNLYPVLGFGEKLYRYNGYFIKYGTPLIGSIQSCIIWTTVMISLERYAVVCKPLLAIRLCKVRKARTAIILIAFLSFLVNLPKFWERTITTNDNITYVATEMKSVSHHPAYRYFYATAFYFISLFIIPVSILFVLSTKLIGTLRKARETWERQQSVANLRERHGENFILRKKNEHTITYVSLAIVLVFIICGTPDVIIKTLIYVWNIKKEAWLVSLVAVSNFLVVVNSASNLIIYCLMGSRFRSDLINLLCPCLKGICRNQRRQFKPDIEGNLGRLLLLPKHAETTGLIGIPRFSLADASLNYVTQTACTTIL